MTVQRLMITCVLSLVALPPKSATAEPCFVVIDDKPQPDVTTPEATVRQIIQLTPSGVAALRSFPLGYVQIFRDQGQQTFVRLLERPSNGPPETRFTFDRGKRTNDRANDDAKYTLRLFGSQMFAWPAPATLGSEVSGCEAVVVEPIESKRRPDFKGARGQWWGAYYPGTRLEVGGSVFVGRLGVAGSGDWRPPRSIGPRDDPKNINPFTGSFEVRWRGARGYLGGGVRYYPDEEIDRDHWRFAFVAGEELPSFKGLPIWLVLNLRLEEPNSYVKGLRPEFGFRFDWWGSRP